MKWLESPFTIEGKGGDFLICLDGTTNNKIEICEALLRRAYFHTEQHQYIDELRKRLIKGSEGEYQLKWFWQDMALSDPHLLFFNFETVKFERFKYQMDAIFICERFVLILECKHIAGEIYYDEATHQLWREYNGQKLVLNDPFSQVMRHEEWMANFLLQQNIQLPIFTAVVITTHSSSLNNMPKQFSIFKFPGLRIKLQQLLQTYPKKVNVNLLQFLHQKLMEQYKPQKWQHPFQDIALKQGALCKCGEIMKYTHGKFICDCGYASKEPLLQGLHDYRLLVDEWITNKQFRSFFNIHDEDVTNKILKRLGFKTEGKTKSRKYLISEDIWLNNRRNL